MEIKGHRCLKCGATLSHVVGSQFEATIQQAELDEAVKHRKVCDGAIEAFTEQTDE